jgi:hypothetical protein
MNPKPHKMTTYLMTVPLNISFKEMRGETNTSLCFFRAKIYAMYKNNTTYNTYFTASTLRERYITGAARAIDANIPAVTLPRSNMVVVWYTITQKWIKVIVVAVTSKKNKTNTSHSENVQISNNKKVKQMQFTRVNLAIALYLFFTRSAM